MRLRWKSGWLILGLLPAFLHAQDAPRKVVPAGGWRVDDGAFAISYQPTQHADRFMKSWLSISASHANKSASAKQIFTTLTDKKQAGQCMKCHSVDAQDDGSFLVHWQAGTAEDSSRASTKFSHAPHLLVLSGDASIDSADQQSGSCFTCHNLSGQSSEQFLGRYFNEHGKVTFDAKIGASNFVPMAKNTCASCHQKNVAGDNCTLCHWYHHR